MLVFNDLTEEKIADRAMAQAEQLSSLGELAAGIAHEINNPISVIMTLSGVMKSQTSMNAYVPDIKKLNDIFSKIEATSERIAKIVRGLRSMSRVAYRDPFATESLQLIIDNVVELTRFKFKASKVQLIVPTNIQEWQVECRESEVVQILVNLVSNAFDALIDLNQKENIVEIRVQQIGNCYEIRVYDSGPGISIEVKKRIMMPFFTTKPKGRGTGLGLSLSKKLARQHGGDLFLDEKSEQTCFVLLLPVRQLKDSVA